MGSLVNKVGFSIHCNNTARHFLGFLYASFPRRDLRVYTHILSPRSVILTLYLALLLCAAFIRKRRKFLLWFPLRTVSVLNAYFHTQNRFTRMK